jgi:DNA-directed RNA polymerase subunit L
MAENESLDLNSPFAWRWKAVLESAIGGEPLEKLSSRVKRALLDSIRKSMEQFARSGVTISEFLKERHSARNLRKLVNQSLSHTYAELLATVLNTHSNAANTECVYKWEHAILDAAFDQIKIKACNGDQDVSLHDLDHRLRDVRTALCYDLELTAINIVRDPGWRPRVRSKKGEARSDQTASLLSMSLVGATSP